MQVWMRNLSALRAIHQWKAERETLPLVYPGIVPYVCSRAHSDFLLPDHFSPWYQSICMGGRNECMQSDVPAPAVHVLYTTCRPAIPSRLHLVGQPLRWVGASAGAAACHWQCFRVVAVEINTRALVALGGGCVRASLLWKSTRMSWCSTRSALSRGGCGNCPCPTRCALSGSTEQH
eukprot:COSAG02_NODE_248_length_27133_cov_45.131723_21_plen_177_part_00